MSAPILWYSPSLGMTLSLHELSLNMVPQLCCHLVQYLMSLMSYYSFIMSQFLSINNPSLFHSFLGRCCVGSSLLFVIIVLALILDVHNDKSFWNPLSMYILCPLLYIGAHSWFSVERCITFHVCMVCSITLF